MSAIQQTCSRSFGRCSPFRDLGRRGGGFEENALLPVRPMACSQDEGIGFANRMLHNSKRLTAERQVSIMLPLELVRLTTLMERTSGSPEVKIGLVDGPVATRHAALASEHLHEIPGGNSATCTRTHSIACLHGTFVAGILSARRGSLAPAICPDCTLLICPIFSEASSGRAGTPGATPLELAEAVIACVDANARIINLSLGLARPSMRGEQALEAALDHAMRHDVIVVAAAGNQGSVGSSVITRHPWVIPVVASDLGGRPLNESNLGGSIGMRGLRAPGDSVTSLGAGEQSLTLGGTSVAAPFVSGAIALLWSEFRGASAAQIKDAITRIVALRRGSVLPPMLDAAAAYEILLKADARRRFA